MFHIAICDDEEYFCIKEKLLITSYMCQKGYKCNIDIFTSGEEILDMGTSISKYNIIFLDINMDKLDGIETAKRIRRITNHTFIVFVTAFITYSLEGYKVDAVRYLLKDDEYLAKAVFECLDTILYKMDYVEHKHKFDFLEGKIEIYLEDILYVDSNLHKLTFHMAGESKRIYTMYEKLDVIHELLQDAGFCRIHKSYLVNLKYVESIERYKAKLIGGLNLAISKARYIDSKNEFICYIGEI